jgi:bifunctional non-homologous end joining protein LigD
MTRQYLPMNAKPAGAPFSGDEWFFEIKWDGIRAISYCNEHLSVRSRNGKEIARQFPELAELKELAPGTVLDGEIVAMVNGLPDIQELLPRLQSGRRLSPGARSTPVTYIVFDILEEDGIPLLNLPLTERRLILLKRVKEGPHVVISMPVETDGEAFFRAAVAKGLEGVMAKRKTSVYEPGVRSGNWLKIKEEKTCDCVISGYTRGEGGRSSLFGALILGLYYSSRDQDYRKKIRVDKAGTSSFGCTGQHLVYIGKVGTGFRDLDLTSLVELFPEY